MGKREDERKLSDLLNYCLGSLDLKASCRGDLGGLLRHGEGQDTVVILGGDGICINALDIEAAAERAVVTLAAHKAVLALFLFFLGLALRGDGQAILVDVDVDVFLLKAGQLSLEDIIAVLLLMSVRKPLTSASFQKPWDISSSSRKGL